MSGEEKPARRAVRVVSWMAVVLFWLVAAGMGYQLFGAWRAAELAAQVKVTERVRVAYEKDWEIRMATRVEREPPRAPEQLMLHVNLSGDIAGVDDEARSDDLKQIAAHFRGVDSLWSGAPDAVAPDMQQSLQMASDPRLANAVQRDYPWTFADGTESCYRFAFHPRAQDADTVPVEVQLSQWQILWERFRPNFYRKGYDDLFTAMEFETNSLGWRDDEAVLPKPDDVYRIVCIGGSTTAEGPRNDLTYPNLLERRLREEFGTDRIEVVNCGIYTYDTSRELANFDRYLELQPDLIVYYNFINDLYVHLDYWYGENGTERSALGSLWVVREYAPGMLLPSRSAIEQRFQETTLSNLEAMRNKANMAGVVMTFSGFAHHTPEQMSPAERRYVSTHSEQLSRWGLTIEHQSELIRIYNEMLRKYCEENFLIFLNTANDVKGGVDVFTDALCHMHLPAMELKAESMANVLRGFVGEQLRERGLVAN